MTQLHFESFHRLIEEYTRELPSIMRQHPLTQKLVPRVTDGLVLNELPFTVAVVGQMRVGKSSLLNTLVGADLAVTGVNETTATINWFKYAPEEKCDRFRVVWRNRPEEELPRTEIERWIGNSEFVRDTLRLEFFADAEFLKNAYIVDTPGTRAVIDSHEETIQNFIASPQDSERTDNASRSQGDRADAIIYVLMPVARQTDEELLQSFEQGSRIPNAAPYNSLAVVHKWETLNADDPYEEVLRKVERIKQSFKNHVAEVLPVSAPMGWACEHFDDDFWEIVFQLGCLPNDVRRKMLLTDKRFFAESPDCPVSVSKRERLKSEYKLPWPTLKFLINRTSIVKATTPTELKEAIRKIAGTAIAVIAENNDSVGGVNDAAVAIDNIAENNTETTNWLRKATGKAKDAVKLEERKQEIKNKAEQMLDEQAPKVVEQAKQKAKALKEAHQPQNEPTSGWFRWFLLYAWYAFCSPYAFVAYVAVILFTLFWQHVMERDKYRVFSGSRAYCFILSLSSVAGLSLTKNHDVGVFVLSLQKIQFILRQHAKVAPRVQFLSLLWAAPWRWDVTAFVLGAVLLIATVRAKRHVIVEEVLGCRGLGHRKDVLRMDIRTKGGDVDTSPCDRPGFYHQPISRATFSASSGRGAT